MKIIVEGQSPPQMLISPISVVLRVSNTNIIINQGGGSADVAEAIHAATTKAIPVDADEMGLADSASAWSLKKFTFANLRTWVRSWGDSIYQAAGNLFNKDTDDTDDITVGAVNKFATAAEKAKLSNITVTQPVDLDQIQSRVNDLDAAVVLKGTWDASGGSFAGGGVAQAGWSYIVSVGGTVDSVDFIVGDRLIAITDNASTTTFAANWFKADYTDQVLSVNGLTGAVTITDANLSTSDVTTNNVSSTKHGFTPKSPADATKFLHGGATPDYALVKDSDLSTSDVTTNNVSTTKHGFAPKGDGDTSKFLNANGAYSSPAGGASDVDIGTTGVLNGNIGRILFHGASDKVQESANFSIDESSTDKILKIGATQQGRIELRVSSNLTAYGTSEHAGRWVAGGDDVSNTAFGYVGGPGGMCFPNNLKIAFGMGGATMFYMQVSSIFQNGLAGITAPTAKLHIPGSATGAGTAPLKLDAGVLMTTPEPGAIETDGTDLWWTDAGGTRRKLNP